MNKSRYLKLTVIEINKKYPIFLTKMSDVPEFLVTDIN